MRRLVSALALTACLVAAPAAAAQDEPKPGPRQETASVGSVTATLDYVMASFFEATDIRLSIMRDGAAAVVEGANLTNPCRECAGAPVGGRDSSMKSLTLRDLTGDGDPEVVVDLYTGGAHCCWVMAVFGWDPARSAYRRVVRNWGDPGFRIADLAAAPGAEILSADGSFAYAFCAYACSAMPGQVFRYQDFRLVNVTKEFPARIRREIRELRSSLRDIRRQPKDDRFALKGILPALCADLYLLRRGAECRRDLSVALRRGELSRDQADIGPSGRRYVRQVLGFLKRTGYR